MCRGTNFILAGTCGRPLGLGFNYLSGDLYVVDANFGFLVVPPNGGLATQLAKAVDGVPFGILDALDIDQATQIVYFTDLGLGGILRLGLGFVLLILYFFSF